MPERVKLTITISGEVLEKAKAKAQGLGLTLSRLIENYLKFFVNPEVYCFKCGVKFDVKQAKICPRCGWLICPSCSACRCTLGEEAAIVAFYMRKVLEDLLVTSIARGNTY